MRRNLAGGFAILPPMRNGKQAFKPAAQPQKELDFLKPAITGGLALGILSSIPIISAM